MVKQGIGIVILMSCAFSMAAQSESSKLTFKEAVKLGLENNVTLNQQKNQMAYTHVNKTASLLQLGPTVQATGSAYRVDGNSFNQNTGEVVNGVIDYVNASVSASMPIFNGLQQVNNFRQASNQNEAQLHAVNRSSQDVIFLVATQYLQCLLDQELVRINQENVETQRTQYNQIKALVDVGSRAEADLYNQEYQVKNAELTLVRSRITLTNDKATLARTIQLDISHDFDVEPVDWEANMEMMDTLSLDNMYVTAMSRRSDLKQAIHREKAAHFGFSSVKARYYPSLYAGLSYGSRYNYIYNADNRSFQDQFGTDNRQLSYGLSLTIPIYSGFQSKSQVAFSKVSYENAKLDLENTEVVVKSDVLLAYRNFRGAVAGYEASASQLRAAELSYKTEKERYDLGISDIVQLTTSNQAFVRAQGDYQSAMFTLMFQRLLMEYALGTLTVDMIP